MNLENNIKITIFKYDVHFQKDLLWKNYSYYSIFYVAEPVYWQGLPCYHLYTCTHITFSLIYDRQFKLEKKKLFYLTVMWYLPQIYCISTQLNGCYNSASFTINTSLLVVFPHFTFMSSQWHHTLTQYNH